MMRMRFLPMMNLPAAFCSGRFAWAWLFFGGCFVFLSLGSICSADVLTGKEMPAAEVQPWLENLAAQRREIETQGGVRIRFVEEKNSPLFVEPMRSAGELFFTPPDRFRRDTVSPAASSVRSDGKTLWMIYPEFREVEEYPLDGPLPLARELQLVGAGLQMRDLQQHFRIRAWREEDGAVTLRMRPKGGRSAMEEMRLRVVDEAGRWRLREVEWRSRDGTRSLLRLSEERNHKAEPDFFRLPEEAGWKVNRPLG